MNELADRIDLFEQENMEMKAEIKDLYGAIEALEERFEESINKLRERYDTFEQHCERAIDNHQDRLNAMEDR